jgi:hypothetical protein
MKTENSKKITLPIKLVTLALIGGFAFNPTIAAAQNSVPIKAIMQSAGEQAAVPARQDANGAIGQGAASAHANGGKAERVTGGILLGSGIAVTTATLVVVSMLHGSFGHADRVWAGVGGGAAMTGAGITLIVLGNHKRTSK